MTNGRTLAIKKPLATGGGGGFTVVEPFDPFVLPFGVVGIFLGAMAFAHPVDALEQEQSFR